MNSIKYIDSNNREIDISVICFFNIEILKKKFVVYTINDNHSSNDSGYVLIGEIIRKNDIIKVIGIKEDEQDIILSVYQEFIKEV